MLVIAIIFFTCVFCVLVEGLEFLEKFLNKYIIQKNIKNAKKIAKFILDAATVGVLLILMLLFVGMIIIF